MKEQRHLQAISNEVSIGVVDFIHETVQRGYPLTVQLNTVATKILFDNDGYAPRAYGVAYEYGENLHYTSPLSTGTRGTPGYVFARKEVIVACGAFETPSKCELLSQFALPLLLTMPISQNCSNSVVLDLQQSCLNGEFQ